MTTDQPAFTRMSSLESAAPDAPNRYNTFIAEGFGALEGRYIEAEGFRVSAFLGHTPQGVIGRIRTRSGRSRQIRSPRAIGSTPTGHFLFYAPRAGGITLSQFGRTLDARPGQGVLLDFDAPFEQSKHGDNDTPFIALPHRPIRLRVGDTHHDLCLRPFDLTRGLGALTADLVRRTAWSPGQMSETELTTALKALHDFIAFFGRPDALDMEGGSPALNALFRRARRLIADRLYDPELSIHDVANACGVSARYVQMAFAEAGVSFRGHLRAARLARARERLAQVSKTGETITDIAYACGFSSSAHFSTAFRLEYGVPPRTARG